jgi:hypothetical protein
MKQEDTFELWEAEDVFKTTFDYDALDSETRAFVRQKAAETHGHLHRSAETVVKIGQNLQAVKERLPHGQFMVWIQAEFGMTYQTARNCIRVAERLGDKVKTVLTLPSKVLYLLAQPSTSDAIIEQVEQGTLAPSFEAIKAAKEAERKALAEAEQQVHAASLWQEQLETARHAAQHQQAELQQQIEVLQAALKRQAAPEVITKEVIPPAILAELEALRQKVARLTDQRNALSKQAEVLAAQAQAAAFQTDEDHEKGRQMRLGWRSVTQETLHLLSRLLLQWPSALDAYHFEEEDWRKLTQLEEQSQKLQQSCQRLRATVERTIVVQPERVHMETEPLSSRRDATP